MQADIFVTHWTRSILNYSTDLIYGVTFILFVMIFPCIWYKSAYTQVKVYEVKMYQLHFYYNLSLFRIPEELH